MTDNITPTLERLPPAPRSERRVQAGGLSILYASGTHVGHVRRDNEDRILTKNRLFMVADGIGGHDAGEVAARICRDTLSDLVDLMRTEPEAALADLTDAVQAANENVYRQNVERKALHQKGPDGRPMTMGSTCTAALVTTGSDLTSQLAIAHVGDSRLYQFRNGVLAQITDDHNAIDVVDGHLVVFPNVLARAIGTHETIEIDSEMVDLEPGDAFLLCSDGLTGGVSDRAIHAALQLHSPGLAVAELIAMALDSGGIDNISAIVFRIEGV